MSDATSTTVSDELEHWLGGDQPKTLGNLIELFGQRSFALIFVLLMALPACRSTPPVRRTSSRP